MIALTDRRMAASRQDPGYREAAEQTVADIPGAELHLIENIDHMPFFEAPDAFYPPFIEFLSTDPL